VAQGESGPGEEGRNALLRKIAIQARKDIDTFVMFVFRVDQAECHSEMQAHMHLERRAGILAHREFGKTTQAMARLLWRIGNNPDIRIKIICGDDDTAVDRIMMARDMISRNRYLKLVFPGMKKNQNFDDWGRKSITVDRPGFSKDSTLEGCGVMTSGTGQRADEILFDDVVTLQNAIAHPSQRDLVKQAFRSTWIPLLGPEGRAIYIATLYHEDDLSCDLRKNSEWKWLDFSVRNDPPFSPWYERWTEAALVKRRSEIGSLDFDRSMRNILHPDDERIVKEAWIRWFSTPPQRGFRIMSWDYAGSGKKSDYVARAVLDVDMAGKVIYVLSVERWRGMTFNEMITKILEEYDRWTPDVVIDEQAAFQIVVGTDERLVGQIPFRHIVPRLSKEERVRQTAVFYENGRILFREGFCKEGVEELLSFPHTKRDDMVDAITLGVSRAIESIGKSFSPELIGHAVPRSIRMGMDLNVGPKSSGERDPHDTMRAGFRGARW
jgi:phage terminase large subunit-like protein